MTQASSPSNKLRVGVIGAGWWATRNHLPLLAAHPSVELVGVSSPGADHVARVKEEFGFTAGVEDYRELLRMELDAVVVASPHDLHHEHAGAAVDMGLTVLCEKPMTLTANSAWDLVSRAERAKAEIVVAYGWNYKPFVQQARELLTEPGIGEIEYVSMRMASPTKDFFSRKAATVPSRFGATLVSTDPATWQTKSKGGGYAHGQLSHATGLLFWLTDLRAQSVIASTSNAGAAVDLYDSVIVSFTGGQTGTLSGAGTLPDDDKFQIDLQIFGSEGVLLLDVERERLELRRHDGVRLAVEVPPGAGDYECVEPVLRFVDIALGHSSALNASPGATGAKGVELLEAALLSADSQGERVGIDLSLGSTTGLKEKE